ncbi:MAG: type II toxin-antitoxin system RelE/ParE family toxin [Planctomycetes bacterium]|nr:type II toxin-antitoxin system RelE/ParE family toxin [Planctomycetota bacterium]
MKFSVFILPQARRDIDRNADWWAEHHSAEEALRWSDAIYGQIATLAEFPQSHGLSAENDDFPYEIRDKLLGLGSRRSYRAVFTIKDHTVYVLTVRRSAQDVIRPSDVESPPSD